MFENKPLLVTGSHRSGTTWVGRMIAQSKAVGYIHEPFNVDLSSGRYPYRAGFVFNRFPHWFTYITDENAAQFLAGLKKTISFHYAPTRVIRAARSSKDLTRMLNDYLLWMNWRLRGARPLVKDPIALFSAEWLASTFNMDVIIMIRHPAAFVSSLKKLNQNFRFADLLEQPLLMRDHLSGFEDEIQRHAQHRFDIVKQSTLLWKIIHYMIKGFKERHPNWIFIRHEDLSLDPLTGFEDLFQRLNLEFTYKVRSNIRKFTGQGNPNEPTDSYDLKRDSKANIWNWKSRLNADEIAQIREQVRDLSQFFYSDKDW